ncbi:MAG: hypothetical protein M5U26_00580 [Planctomycetota bacterium]|nr:hypothetical protein [Planctomycetota bacterium]
MSKKKKDKEPEAAPAVAAPPAAPQTAPFKAPLWALIVGVLFAVWAAVQFATREARERSGFVGALNDANVNVAKIEDGLAKGFGETFLTTNQKPYRELLGCIETQPALAKAVFHEALANGTRAGRILACRMAPYFAQANNLTREDLELVVKQLDDKDNHDVQTVAQWTLSRVLAVADLDKNAATAIQAKPEDPKAKWKAEAMEDEYFGRKFLELQWSTPEACRAWWKERGGSAEWDEHFKRYRIGEAKPERTAQAGEKTAGGGP